MSRIWKPLIALLPLLLCVLLGGCGAGEASAVLPEFFGDAKIELESGSGRLREGVFQVESPETLAGMELSVSGGIVSVSFGGITKTSDTTAGLSELAPARLLLYLEDLSGAQMNFQSFSEENAKYSAATSLGDYTVIANMSGGVSYVKNETTGFTARFTALTEG